MFDYTVRPISDRTMFRGIHRDSPFGGQAARAGVVVIGVVTVGLIVVVVWLVLRQAWGGRR